MTSLRFTCILVVVFAAILYASGVTVSAMENLDTSFIETTAPIDVDLDSDAQRRLRGAMKQDPTDEERGPSHAAGLEKMFNNRNNSWMTRFVEIMKKIKSSIDKQWIKWKFFIKGMKKSRTAGGKF
ncbi:hypothetical protein KXD40_003833 [Peronospora effusa]|uniref:RxLR effector protein n=1 Tax=Peronospora effusa TaxID=542832 RepID=A0A3M6VBK6_9STRA|nr:hypothetical protein DD238_007018 [Peronospora effusa]RQM14056.1 hypothetical protein DD237_000228 [Peronospora effusa]UIZ23056.1 hypothetical protein KXD40_003833 [Peronospora effusa]CAI5703207.1 unnamed protein product [Peronospora effusa]